MDGFDALVGVCAIWMRKELVAGLMQGNDTACWTTQQYLEAWEKRWWKSGMGIEMARKHLEGLNDWGVREVGNDVWTKE